jgi:hypothetical protein
MPSVKPLMATDLNGVEFNPDEMIMDDIAGYVGYVKSLCTTLGTPEDTEGGYKDFLDFQKEIQSAHISTFEPNIVDTRHSFEMIDLTGASVPLREYPMLTYGAYVNNKPFFGNSKGVTPFDLPEKGTVMADRKLSPYDIDGFDEILKAIEKSRNNNEIDLT